jgi:hypothetical protein
MMLSVLLLLELAALCRGYVLGNAPAMLISNFISTPSRSPSRHTRVVLRSPNNNNNKRGADKLTRRELANGSSLAKQFYDPEGFRAGLPVGWSPALVLFLGAAVSNYGGNVRSKLYDELRAFGESSSKNQGAVSHVPVVTIARGRSSGQVSVEVGAGGGDPIDYIWATDAATGEILAGRRFSPNEPPTLMFNVDRGRRIVPSVHCKNDGVWEGEALAAVAQ